MFRGIFVTGTDTNVGKTAVSAALRKSPLPSVTQPCDFASQTVCVVRTHNYKFNFVDVELG